MLYADARDADLSRKLAALAPVPGYCICVDIVGSTGLKGAGLAAWVTTTLEAFTCARSCLYAKFPPIKSIGDALMFFIPSDGMQGETAASLLAACCEMAVDHRITAATRLAGVLCEEAYPITFMAGRPDYHGVAFDVLNRLSSWRLSAAAAAALVVPAGLAFQALTPPESAAHPRSSLRADLAALLALPVLRLLTLLVVLGYTGIIAFTTWAPTRLVAYGGLAAQTAALIASVLLVIDIPFAPLWGRVSDGLGRRKPLIVASFLVYGAGAFLVPAAARAGVLPLLLVVGAMGIGCAMFFPATLAVPQAIVPETLLGAAYGLFLTAQALGMTLGPLALGVVFDHATVPVGFFVIGGIAAAGLGASLRLETA